MEKEIVMEKEARNLFISYSSSDLDLVRDFLKDFNKNNITTWIDIDNLHNYPGRPFDEEIKKNIEDSDQFFMIYSQGVINRPGYIMDELKYAIEKDKKILVFPFFNEGEGHNHNSHDQFKDYFMKVQWLCTSKQLDRIPDLKEYLEGNNMYNSLSSLVKEDVESYDSKISTDIIFARIGIQKSLGKELLPFGTYTTFISNPKAFSCEELKMVVQNKSFIICPNNAQKKRILSFMENERAKEWHNEIKPFNYDDIDRGEIYNLMVTFICENCEVDVSEANGIINDAIELAVCHIERGVKEERILFNGPMVGIYNITTKIIPGFEDKRLNIELYQSDYFTFKFTGELFHLLRKRGISFNIDFKIPGNIKKHSPFLCSLGLGGFIIVKRGGVYPNHLMWVKRSKLVQAHHLWHFSYDETIHLTKDLKIDSNGMPIRTNDGRLILSQDIAAIRAIKEELFLDKKISFEKGILEIGLIECDRLEVELLSYAVVETDPKHSIEEQLGIYTDMAADSLEIEKIDYIQFSSNKINNALHGKFLTPESYMLAKKLLALSEK